ncbi:hypothetical protein DIRU0_E32792 [Diutina rugosa]
MHSHSCATACCCAHEPRWQTMLCDCGRQTVRCPTCGGFATPRSSWSRPVMSHVTRMRRTATFDSLVEVDAEMVAKFVELAQRDRDSQASTPQSSLQSSSSSSSSPRPQSRPPPPPRYSDHFYFTPMTETN